jgi:hypothetical protein
MIAAIILVVVVLPLVPVTATIGTRPTPVGKEHVDDGPPDVAGVALGRVGVHPEAGGGVDLDDAAAGLADGTGDVRGDQVDPGHVEADDHRRLAGDLGVVGVDVVGPVDGGAAGRHVAGPLEQDASARLRDIVQRQPLASEGLHRLRVDGDPGQDLLVADAAAGVGVGPLDQLGDGPLAVADDVGRHPLGDGDDLVGDHQDPVVLAGDEGLDEDGAVAALPPGGREGLADGGLVRQVDHHPPAVVAVERLQHDRVAEAAGGGDRLLLPADHRRAGDGDADLVQHPVGQLLVAGHLDGGVARLAGDGRPDPLLVAAVAELDQRAAGVEPQHRDAPPLRLGHDRPRRGAVGQPLGDPDHPVFQLPGIIEVGLDPVDEVVQEAASQPTGGQPDVLLEVRIDDVVDAPLAGRAGLAAGHLGPGQVLQLERDVLQDVAHPGPLAQPLEEAAGAAERAAVVVEGRDELDQALGEAGDRIGRPILKLPEVDDQVDDRHPAKRSARGTPWCGGSAA